MGLFNKKIYLLNVSYNFKYRDKETVNIVDRHPDLKPIEFVHLTLYQYSKILYTIPINLPDIDYLLKNLVNIGDDDNLIEIFNFILKDLREMYSDQNSNESKYISKLYFKSVIQRGLKTKFPFIISNNELIRTIPLTAKLTIENSTDLEKEILRAAIKFQTDKYLGGFDYRSIQNMINMPMTAFQNGFENRKVEI
ncbi:hypothetical protein ES705_10425 [subsurface metagenome]